MINAFVNEMILNFRNRFSQFAPSVRIKFDCHVSVFLSGKKFRCKTIQFCFFKEIRKFSVPKDGSDISKIVQQEVGLNHVHSKQWIKGNVVNFICETKSVPKQEALIMATWPSKVVQWTKTCFPSWLLFPIFIESCRKSVNIRGIPKLTGKIPT